MLNLLVVGVVGPLSLERRLGLTDEDGSPGSVAKLLVDVAVSSAHRCFCGAQYIDPQQRSTVKGRLPLLTICSQTVRIDLDVVARCWGKPAGQGTATDGTGPEGMWIRGMGWWFKSRHFS